MHATTMPRPCALGDGEAMSGAEVAALREGGDAVFLILRLD